jgi:plastocyanin
MNSTGWIAVVAVLVLIVLGAWWYTTQPAADTNVNLNQNATTTDNVPDVVATTTEPQTVTVNYTSAGFSPATVTINKGDTVTWSNGGSGSMWVASAVHPTHEVYDGTTRTEHCAAGTTPKPFDQCANGSTYSFTFDKTGTFKYHNHSAAQLTGTVVVQ